MNCTGRIAVTLGVLTLIAPATRVAGDAAAAPQADNPAASSAPQLRIGNALIEVRSIRVAKPSIRRDGKARKLSTEGLIVKIQITNTGDSAAIDYHTWNLPNDATKALAKGVDDKGKPVALFGQWPYYGGHVKSESIRPGKWFRDMLVFKAPSDNAKSVTLELPGEYVGGEGVHKLVIALDS